MVYIYWFVVQTYRSACLSNVQIFKGKKEKPCCCLPWNTLVASLPKTSHPSPFFRPQWMRPPTPYSRLLMCIIQINHDHTSWRVSCLICCRDCESASSQSGEGGRGPVRRQRGREVMCSPACLLIIQQMYEAGCWSQNRWQERARQPGSREQPEVRGGRENNTGDEGDLKDGQCCRNDWLLRSASST